jgi:hypothetical protein
MIRICLYAVLTGDVTFNGAQGSNSGGETQHEGSSLPPNCGFLMNYVHTNEIINHYTKSVICKEIRTCQTPLLVGNSPIVRSPVHDEAEVVPVLSQLNPISTFKFYICNTYANLQCLPMP